MSKSLNPPKVPHVAVSFPHPHIVLVTINRPEHLNALQRQMSIDLDRLWRWYDNEPTLRCAILTGTGRAFCAGADLKEWNVKNSEGNVKNVERWAENGFGGLSNRHGKKPVIAAVNGLCLGGGMEMALNVDMVIASETAKFGLPEVKRGVVAIAGALPRLIRTVGRQRASEVALLGRMYSAQQFLDWGIVNKVVKLEDVVQEALKWAVEMSGNSPDSIIVTREGLLGGWEAEGPRESTNRIDGGIYKGMEGGDNMKEGVLSFVEKRNAVWKDKLNAAQTWAATNVDGFHLAPNSLNESVKGHPDSSRDFQSRPSTPGMAPDAGIGYGRKPRKLVLCFDGTGNKFHGDDSDSNILKIFRMLDRQADDQYHYYQPGIGTYVVSGSLTHTGIRARFGSWYQKAKDSAIGSSFDQHVVGGYRFLMRFYNPGDEIYMFGFSRGAYIARFLAEMLDYIGLLSHGNEEMVKFAWKAFAQWQGREQVPEDEEDCDKPPSKETEAAKKKRDEMFQFMKGFRETFSRPVGRIRFLGLFDTVNSVPRFETAWMQRSKFPYTARSSARVIRHAVSIDERRAKFRQDLMYQDRPKQKDDKGHHFHKAINDVREELNGHDANGHNDRGRKSNHLSPNDKRGGRKKKGNAYAPYRARSRSCRRPSQCGDPDNFSNLSGLALDEINNIDDDAAQDIDEVWFSGGHADVGGGWEMLEGSKSTSHIPLAWIVREAQKAGLTFDDEKVAEMGCCAAHDWQEATGRPPIPDLRVSSGSGGPGRAPDMPMDEKEDHPKNDFHSVMHGACTARIHDSLEYGQGLGPFAVTAWKIMEYMPFRRMDLQSDGSWKPIRWPLPGGEVRDIPDTVRVHGSVIRRMKLDENYRPGNLIIGGGGRGVRKASAQHGIGDWECVADPGDPVGEIWMRKKKDDRYRD
ncbi:short chain dehydrogenase reductase family [Fusarium tjaetaba]|uniref:Short chain dehydrogenase reductase family n=1 Tax=Fusarium tjaetaba TaxID=1567544 RepID=A0A8H5QYA6_9HYPO|nr:short chain dehydrogenase reductase family [Fusarium tjaetaba]KAF5622793.1 short chain dehydrogenase reductase family [Fusarium tjaetaba]